MHALRLYFKDDEPLDVHATDVLGIHPTGHFLHVEIYEEGRDTHDTLVAVNATPIEREEGADVDLHQAYRHE